MGDEIDISSVTQRMVAEARGTAPPKDAAPKPAAARELTPRKVQFGVEVEDPDTGAIATHTIVSQVCSGTEDQSIANLAVDMAKGRQLEMFAADDRDKILARARCLIQIRNLTPEVTRLLWEDAGFLAHVHARLVMHENRFRPGDISPDGSAGGAGQGAPRKPRVVVHEWRAADAVRPPT